jgi:hypothetical protein
MNGSLERGPIDANQMTNNLQDFHKIGDYICS